VNLAVLNFLPIPIVDGGLMVFLIIEKLKGSPASPKVQTVAALLGIAGLACVFLYVTFNDIARIVTGA
ncbi:MAG: site-2 protease family protein, partial [Planctomycetota bacterium]